MTRAISHIYVNYAPIMHVQLAKFCCKIDHLDDYATPNYVPFLRRHDA